MANGTVKLIFLQNIFLNANHLYSDLVLESWAFLCQTVKDTPLGPFHVIAFYFEKMTSSELDEIWHS